MVRGAVDIRRLDVVITVGVEQGADRIARG